MLQQFFQTLTPEVILGGLLIFFMRTVDMSMDTLRVLFVVRGKKLIVWILGVLQSIIYISAISNVLKGDQHPFTILCYACGYATGNICGMFIEGKLGIGFKQLTIISKEKGPAIASSLRDHGFGATELLGHGMEGNVTIINCRIKRRQVPEAREIISKVDPHAFVTEDDFTPVNSGHWRK